MVEQSGEPFLLSFLCCLPHTVQPLGHALPALCRAHVRLNDVLLRLRPSLPPPASAEGCPSLFGWFTGVGSEVAQRGSPMLATVRRSNRACSFPAHGFHDDSRFRDAIEG